MAHISNEPKDSPAPDEARNPIGDPVVTIPNSPDLRQPAREPVGLDAAVADDFDPLNGETIRDLNGPVDGGAIADRIRHLNRFFDQAPASKPKYRVLEIIGRGGMGSVLKAEQRTPVKRLVAIKLVKPGFDSKEVIARFESERQALARMDHGSVAKVFDAGADDLGRPYFVMEYVPGIAITDFADQNKLTIKLRLELFIEVCSAIAHAHSKGIIHRDIKASNVLAYFSEGRPVVKIIDFGIAKALAGDRLTEATMNTRHGQLLGTYHSMSPEQAEGSPDIDTRTDVYSLGVLLYELLTGAAPFDKRVFQRSADQEIRRIIREVEPPRPCTRLSSMGDVATKVALARQEPLDVLVAELRSELEWIPLMAMRKSRDRRYATPLELADDIKRYLEHRPLRAGPESMWYVAKKSLRRHRFAVAAALAVFISLAGGVIVSTYLLSRAVRAEHAVAREVEEVENAMAFGGDSEADRNDLISARRFYANALDQLRANREASSAVLAGLSEIESWQDGELPLLGSFGVEGGVAAFRGHTSHPNSVAVLPGFRALTAGYDGNLYLWNLLTGREILHRRCGDKPLAYVAISADRTVAATAGYDGIVRLWDTGTLSQQDPVLEIPDKPQVWMLAISPDGKRIVAGTNDKKLWLWEKNGQWQAGRKLWEAPVAIPAIAFPPKQSRFVMVGDIRGGLSLWDLQEGKRLWITPEDERHSRQVNCAAFSDDGTKAATASFDGTVILWGVQDQGAAMRLVRGDVLHLRGKAWRVAFSPGGKKLAVGADGGLVEIYDVESGKPMRQFIAQQDSVMGVAFLDDTTLVSTGDDTMGVDGKSLSSALRLWDLSDHGTVVPGAAKSPARRITVDDSGHAQIETASGDRFGVSFGPDGRIQPATENASDILADMPADYSAALRHKSWLRGAHRTSTPPQGTSAVPPAGGWQELAGSDNGSIKFFTNDQNELELRGSVEDASGAESHRVHLRTLHGHAARIVAAGISRNGRFIVSIDEQGRCLGWDLLRPAVCRDFEQRLASSRTSDDIVDLKKWYVFRGREDLAGLVK